MLSISAVKEQLERREKETVTEKEAETYYQRYSAIYLAENMPEEQKKRFAGTSTVVTMIFCTKGTL